jgi:small subunit ribosomal protein S17
MKERRPSRFSSGVVCSVGMQKTAKLKISYIKKHKLYKKYIRMEKTLLFHDENDECRIGDTVKVVETRPLSRHKRHRLVEIINRAPLAEV